MARAGETLDVRNRLAHHMRDREFAWCMRAAIIYGPAVDKLPMGTLAVQDQLSRRGSAGA
jgi:hypothetical protein